ncbi:odorant receptor 46a-like [Battus philenor]|uniref:odorant receptor 46a-like n=1 Tax=Battus philenor TaxID=42288 RepID=UPI0035CF7317
MALFVENVSFSVRVSLTSLRLFGFWPPENISNHGKVWYNLYGFFSFMFMLGTYIIIQVVDLILIWGDIALMTATAFVLLTNLAQLTKLVNLKMKEQMIRNVISDADQILRSEEGDTSKEIVKQCSREMTLLQLLYIGLSAVTMTGWAASSETNKLPLRAWYPYDSSKSPAYELTYMHQVSALLVAAFLNISKDTLVTALIAQCRCRLRLSSLALRELTSDLDIRGDVLTSEQGIIISTRLRNCVERHQKTLHAAQQLQTCFSEPTFVQFTVSLVIICVTAFQLVSQVGNVVRLLSMTTYLLNMIFQVFLYCYQGNQLSEESLAVSVAAYESQWHSFSVTQRRSLLIVMTRCRRAARITAGGFTVLSLASFMAIIKASYSLFTLLQQADEKK